MNDPIRAVDRYATAIEGRLRKLKQAEKAASAAGNTEVLKNLAQRRIELMQSFNKRYNALAER